MLLRNKRFLMFTVVSEVLLVFLMGSIDGRCQSSYTYSTVDFPGARLTRATGINASHQVVGVYQDSASFSHGFLLKNGTTCKPDASNCPTVDPPGSFGTSITGINDSGSIVGFYEAFGSPSPRGFLFSDGKFVPIDFPSAVSTTPTGINNSGQVVGFYQSAGVNGPVQGFIWFDGVFSTIDLCLSYPDLQRPRTFLQAINNLGEIVGYCTSGDDLPQGFLISKNTITFLGFVPLSINSHNQMVGTDFSSTFVVLNGTGCNNSGNCITISFPHANRTAAAAISDHQQIVGNYLLNSAFHGFIATEGCRSTLMQEWSQNDPAWGSDRYDFCGLSGPSCIGSNSTMSRLGCSTTALAMTLKAEGIANLPTLFGGRTPIDPGSLNEFMINLGFPADYNVEHNVDWDIATRDVGLANGKRLYFNRIQGNSLTQPEQAIEALRGAVCEGHAVIVRVAPISLCSVHFAPPGGHFVVVTGAHDDLNGTHFDIVDPGCASFSSLDVYQNEFEIVGFVVDPEVDISGLDLSVGDAADLIVNDSKARRVGFDIQTGHIFNELPTAVYSRDFLTDVITAERATGTIHSIQIFQPDHGSYEVTITGYRLSTYNLFIAPFSQDGSSQPRFSIAGLTNSGTSSNFQIHFNPLAGANSRVIRTATFQSLIIDIQNSLELRLIDNQGTANSLIRKINAAQDAMRRSQNNAARNILNALKNELETQSGRHIIGVAGGVLVQDVDWLLHQL